MNNVYSINKVKEKELFDILSKMSRILSNPVGPEEHYVKDFLECANRLFSNWQSTMNQIANHSLGENKFWEFFERFLNECKNGSWSGMARHKPVIEHYKKELYAAVSQMLSARNDIKNVINIIKNTTLSSGLNKIEGLTAFPMTGMLFAFDQANFMILDEPVLDYFDLNGNYDAALSNYNFIIDT